MNSPIKPKHKIQKTKINPNDEMLKKEILAVLSIANKSEQPYLEVVETLKLLEIKKQTTSLKIIAEVLEDKL